MKLVKQKGPSKILMEESFLQDGVHGESEMISTPLVMISTTFEF